MVINLGCNCLHSFCFLAAVVQLPFSSLLSLPLFFFLAVLLNSLFILNNVKVLCCLELVNDTHRLGVAMGLGLGLGQVGSGGLGMTRTVQVWSFCHETDLYRLSKAYYRLSNLSVHRLTRTASYSGAICTTQFWYHMFQRGEILLQGRKCSQWVRKEEKIWVGLTCRYIINWEMHSCWSVVCFARNEISADFDKICLIHRNEGSD